jgi:hypothetical protein
MKPLTLQLTYLPKNSFIILLPITQRPEPDIILVIEYKFHINRFTSSTLYFTELSNCYFAH